MSNEPSGFQPPSDPGFPAYRSRRKPERQSWHSYQPPQNQRDGATPARTAMAPLQPSRSPRTVIVVVLVVIVLVAGGVFGLRAVWGPSGPAEVPNDGPNAERSVAWWMTDDRLAEILEAKIERNRDALGSGVHPLWDQIEHTDRNQTALRALNYFLIDLRVATGMGVSGAEIREYQELTNQYEERFWAGEPLGQDVTIRSKERTFTYDGATGEGGWTEN